MTKKKSNLRSICFYVPLYGFDVCVIVGAKNKEDVRYQLEKHKVKKEVREWFINHKDFETLIKKEAGSICPPDDLRLIYLFQKWEPNDYNRKVLVHEVSHMVDDIARHKNLVHETEARAYLSEYLFDTIHKNL